VSLRNAEKSLPQKRISALPKGTEPSIKWNGKEGYIDSPLLTEAPDEGVWKEIIADWDLDPRKVEIVEGSVHIRGWDANVGNGEVKRMRYYRASIKSREELGDRADIEALCQEVMRWKAPKGKRPEAGTGNRAFVIIVSDWQAGKGEGGGSPALIERVNQSFEIAIDRLRELVKCGRTPSVIYIIGLGDLIENCTGHYAQQTFGVDLDRRSQMRLVRRLLLKFVDMLVELFDIPIVLGAVAGNHGENRNASGKSFTQWTDNDDLAVFEQLGEILSQNPKYEQVTVPDFDAILNDDDLSLTLDICGVPTSFAHGHQFGKGGNSVQKIEAWLTGQVMGKRPVSQCAILFSGHYHHFVCSEGTGRTIFQSPALDGGSNWFTSQTGKHSPAGMITIGIGLDYGVRGWGDLMVIGQ